MTEDPPTRPPRRNPRKTAARKSPTPDVMRVVEALNRGDYDEQLGMIQGALSDRLRQKQEAVLGLVKEVFGDDYVVTNSQPNQPAPGPRQEPSGVGPTPVAQSSPDEEVDAIGSTRHPSEEEMEIESRGARFDLPPGASAEEAGGSDA